MATTGYMAGRKNYARPQAMLWSDTPGTLSDGLYVPSGYEVYSNKTGLTSTQTSDSFIILSDHNRNAIDVAPQRIEQKKRMANGTMRSYHIADKLNITTSWNLLPSRAFSGYANFNQTTGIPTPNITAANRDASGTTDVIHENAYTVDGGAGGAEILKWYQDHTGPFWVFLSYDKYINFGIDNAAHQHLNQYSQIVQMYFSNFTYNVVKRGGSNHDLWNVSVTLEEV